MALLRLIQALVVGGMLTASVGVAAEKLRLAVAANFAMPIEEIVQAFTAASGHQVVITTGSTGKFFAQIQQGAPFDAFLSADQVTATQLTELGLAVPRSICRNRRRS